MKFLQKHLYWLICTAILATAILYSSMWTEDPLPQFSVRSRSGAQEISIYEAEDGCCYVFLPSYATMDQVTVVMSAGQEASLDGIRLSDGMNCGSFAPEIPYRLDVNGRYTATLWFYKSANVPTLYIDTASGSMEYIHRDKNYEESAAITMYNTNGDIDSTTSGTIKGRGNASWDNPKKPYALILPSDTNFLDMGAASNWILLANAFDETNLRNKLVFELARQVGAEWSPDFTYTDVYLNGEYSGLYLLTEKIETGANRLDIDTGTGAFLCKVDLYTRWNTLRNPFTTTAGRTVEITEPRYPSDTVLSEIEGLVTQMEQSILSGADLRSAANIDLDSWIRRYLIDEISANIDSDLASSYFYYSDGVFYAGPIWDYDISFGNSPRNKFPTAFIAKNARKTASLDSPYYSALYQNASFRDRMCRIFQTEFLPLLEQLINGGIEAQAAGIEAASKMNSRRWETMFRTMYTDGTVLRSTPASLTQYIAARTDFLRDAWIARREYCTLQFRIPSGSEYRTISTPKGTLLETDEIDLINKTWFHEETGAPMDFLQPITEDATFTQNPPVNSGAENTITTSDIVTAASIALLTALFLIFLVIKI